MSFEVVNKFENKIAEFFGAPYAVAVDCCTHGIELCLRQQEVLTLIVPKRTYLSVPMLANKLNIRLQWSDEQLISQGWTPEQISTWRAQQAQTTYQQSIPRNEITGGVAGASHSERVVSHVMQKYGLTDRASFLAAAEFFDADGNRYLTAAELEEAARSLGEVA